MATQTGGVVVEDLLPQLGGAVGGRDVDLGVGVLPPPVVVVVVPPGLQLGGQVRGIPVVLGPVLLLELPVVHHRIGSP